MITILAFDADPGVRLTARRVLERAGFTVITAADRRSVLACLASLKVDLVICDIDEDRSSGPTLRDSGNWDPGMRMLVLSRKDLSSPAPVTCDDGLLSKPFTESELLTAVRRSLAQPAPRSQRRRGGARATIKPIKCRGHANEGGTSCEMQTGKQ
jgi:DNA-binding NtrC family response regulator